MEALQDLSNKHFDSLRLTRVTATADAQTASNKDQHGVLNMTPFRMVISQLRCGGITLEGEMFCSYLNKPLLWTPICFPSLQCFCHNNDPSTYRMLLRHLGIRSAVLLIWDSLQSKSSIAVGTCSSKSRVLSCFLLEKQFHMYSVSTPAQPHSNRPWAWSPFYEEIKSTDILCQTYHLV